MKTKTSTYSHKKTNNKSNPPHKGGFFVLQGIYYYENHNHERSVKVNQRRLQ